MEQSRVKRVFEWNLLNSAICFCENKTNTLDGAFFARLEPDPRVEPLCESAGVAADAGVSAAVSAADSAADPSSFAFFFLTFFSLSAYLGVENRETWEKWFMWTTPTKIYDVMIARVVEKS